MSNSDIVSHCIVSVTKPYERLGESSNGGAVFHAGSECLKICTSSLTFSHHPEDTLALPTGFMVAFTSHFLEMSAKNSLSRGSSVFLRQGG